MGSLEVRERLAALEKARAELDAGLAGDEHWQALSQAARNGAGTEARARAEAALAANPLYLALKHLDEAIGALRQSQEEAPPPLPPVAGAAGTEVADDLTRIRGVSPTLARRLGVLGVTSFGQIAEWNADDVHAMSDALGLDREISRQNWIEQAALHSGRKSGIRSAAAAIPAVASWEPAAPKTEEPAPPKPDAMLLADGESPPSADLPEDIRILIRDGADAIASGEVDAEAEPAGKDAALAKSSQADAAKEPAGAGIPTVPLIAEGPRGGAHLDAAERVQRLEEELRRLAEEADGAPADAAETPAEEEVTRPDGDGQSPRFFDREAKVTFIVREPRTISPTPDKPPTLNGADGAGVSGPANGRDVEAFAAPSERAEEAEVTIVKADGTAVPKKEADRPPSTVRRFLKALSGD